MNQTIYYLIGINIVSFLVMGWDKYSAIKNHWRIKENTLLGLAFIGGSAGTLLGMFIFHHKTKKRKFQILVPIFLIINILIYKIYY